MRRAIPCLLLIGLAACGEGGGPSTPVGPTLPLVNRPPVINSMTFTPSFGIANLTTFYYSAEASDPEGDTVTYRWMMGDNTDIVYSTASGTRVFTSGVNTVAILYVTDGKGGNASDVRTFVVGSMTGSWTGTLAGVPFTMNLTQPAGGTVTGTWTLPRVPVSGNLDLAALNQIDANAAVTLRCKGTAGGGPGGFSDFTLTGTMDTSGVRVSGVVNGPGFTGEPFVLTK